MATWVRSSHCDTGTCVEVTYTDNEVLMRDSKDPDGPVLRFAKGQWHEFVQSLKD